MTGDLNSKTLMTLRMKSWLWSKTRMMESLMKLPDDIFNQEILQYLTLNNIDKLHNACMNHEYRPQLLEKIDGVILETMRSMLMYSKLTIIFSKKQFAV